MISNDELRIIRNSLDVPRIIFTDVICQKIGPFEFKGHMFHELGTLYLNILHVWKDIMSSRWGVGLPFWDSLCDIVNDLDYDMVYRNLRNINGNKYKDGINIEWHKFCDKISSDTSLHPIWKAIWVFLWFTREQPFNDYNLELGLLLANKVLAEEEYLGELKSGVGDGHGVLSLPKKHRDSDIILWQELSRYMNGASDVNIEYLLNEMEKLCHI